MATKKKGNHKVHSREFIVRDYKYRLKLLREIISGENQPAFAKRLGIPWKRWNTYERGYPIPRETAFLLLQKFEGISVEWLWFGMTGNMSPGFLKKIEEVEQLHREREASTRSVERAQAKLAQVETRLRKAPVVKPVSKRVLRKRSPAVSRRVGISGPHRS
jgi:hypothetical protein